VHIPHHLMTTQEEPWGFIKSSTQNKAVHIKLSLCLSFQLRRSLRGYTVGITVGFRIMTMEALAPWPHHQILQWYP
jgi:hypothetical protein